MLHSLTGFDHLLIRVPDLAEASAVFARLGFAVEQDRIRLGAMHLRLEAAEGKARFGHLAFASTDVQASEKAFIALPGLSHQVVPLSPPLLGAHDNKGQAIASLTAVLENPEAAMPAYDAVFGNFAATPTDDMVTVHGGGPLLFLTDEDGFDHLHSNLAVRLSGQPGLEAIAITVSNLDAAEAVLKSNTVRFSRLGESIAIHPDHCLGLGIELVSA